MKKITLIILFLLVLFIASDWWYSTSAEDWQWSKSKIIPFALELLTAIGLALYVHSSFTKTCKVILRGDEILVRRQRKKMTIKLTECALPEANGKGMGGFLQSVELYSLPFKRDTIFGNSIYFQTSHFFLNEKRYNFADFLKGRIIEAQRIEKGLPPSGRR